MKVNEPPITDIIFHKNQPDLYQKSGAQNMKPEVYRPNR
jgi:hypothetical protein